MIDYLTVAHEAEAEQIIEKSRFISYIKSVETREDAGEFIDKIKDLHKNATHNVPAYVIGEKSQLQWASDDGEPSGTSGAPILHLLTAESVTNTVIVVTRYFGGIKLGTGGLVRAYTGSARLALNKAGLCRVKELGTLEFSIDYSNYGKLQNMESKELFKIVDTGFEDVVRIKLQMEQEQVNAVITLLSEMTGGKSNIDNITIGKTLGKYNI